MAKFQAALVTACRYYNYRPKNDASVLDKGLVEPKVLAMEI